MELASLEGTAMRFCCFIEGLAKAETARGAKFAAAFLCRHRETGQNGRKLDNGPAGR